MTVELIITVEACPPGAAEEPAREARVPGSPSAVAGAGPRPAAGPLGGLERAAFFAALRRKADARLAALG